MSIYTKQNKSNVLPLVSFEDKASTCKGNSINQNSSDLSTTLKVTLSYHVHSFGVKNRKNNVFKQLYLYWVLRTTHLKIAQKVRFQIVHLTQLTLHQVRMVLTNLSFYNEKVQQDSSECILLLIDIVNKGSADEHMATLFRDSLSERSFIFIRSGKKYIVCGICGLNDT